DLKPGETVLVHGAAGGVGTATLQVAKGYGARTIAVVSTEEKAEVARAAGADDAVLLDGFKDAVMELTGGQGVDIVLDVVGGDAFTDSLRVLATQGRLLVVGFAGGQGIPEVKVNRLLLNNVDVRGVGWGAYAMTRPGYMQQQWQALLPMMASGVVKPPVGKVYPLEDFGQALVDMDERRTLGKSVVRLR
ncbi:MAG: zinc-binding dehydrogenase, partial [Nocardioides sp.]